MSEYIILSHRASFEALRRLLIYLEEEYRNKKIGTNIITNILKSNPLVYLWVYKENTKAISLYKKMKFKVINETETRYYMEYSK